MELQLLTLSFDTNIIFLSETFLDSSVEASETNNI